MAANLIPKTALAALAAVGLLLPFGTPLPGSCLRTIGVARAAPPPSPSCGGDLRECLRAKADMHPGWNFGVRYVTAEDVADCMDAFRSCTSGGASRGGNASSPKSSAAPGSTIKSLPERFSITVSSSLDCQANGNAVTCTGNPGHPQATVQVDKLTGTLSGLTLTGSRTRHMEIPDDRGPSCPIIVDHSAPVTIIFNLNGTAVVRDGPTKVSVASGCGEPAVNTVPAEEYTQKWSPTG